MSYMSAFLQLMRKTWTLNSMFSESIHALCVVRYDFFASLFSVKLFLSIVF